MAQPIKIDHVEEGAKLLPSQWENTTRVQGLLQSYMESVQVLEDTCFDIREGFNVNTAANNQLELLGELRGIQRLGRSDVQYRQAILSEISVSNGSGTPADLLNLLASLTGGDSQYLWEHYPLGHIMYTNTKANYGIPRRIRAATGAAITGGYVIFDPNETCYAPINASIETFNLFDNANNQIVTETPENIVVETLGEGVDLLGRSSFPDSSEPTTTKPLPMCGYLDAIQGTEVGYGLNYGISYGGTP